LLGKHIGLFTDRLEVSARNYEPLVPDMTEAEVIERLLEKRARRARNVTPGEFRPLQHRDRGR
jgi:hypothetical protein